MKKINKHDKLIVNLENRLLNSIIPYDAILHKAEYLLGEIDLLASYINKNNVAYALVFEMKSHDSKKNRKKAYEQLQRSSNYLIRNYDKVIPFYVSNRGIEKW